VEKPKLFLHSAAGIDLYPYFQSVIYPEKYPEKLSPFSLSEKDYCLSLPLLVVSPRIYLNDARLAAALGMDKTVFRALCCGANAILPKGSEKFDAPTEAFRDSIILKSSSGEGYRGEKALRYLCERYLEGLSLREDAVISAVRVDEKTARALLEDAENFLKDQLHMAYAQVFSRSVRLARVAILKAPEIIVRNEIQLLHRALDRLSEAAPFDTE